MAQTIVFGDHNLYKPDESTAQYKLVIVLCSYGPMKIGDCNILFRPNNYLLVTENMFL